MILADKIINERKKNGWSQEELAEMLSVSRQAVSKWESTQSIPDLQRIIQMADLFGVSTDYLLKDSMETSDVAVESDYMENETVRRVSFEEASTFLDMKKKSAPIIAGATMMCILSPALLILLVALSESNIVHISEKLASIIGLVFLFGMVATAVYMFITEGIKMSRHEHLGYEYFETEYGVTGMAREKKNAYEPTFSRSLAFGVGLCIVSVIPVVVAGCMEAPGYVCAALVALLLLMVAVGVNLIIRVSIIRGSYQTLLQEGEYTKAEKRTKKKRDAFETAYWCLATAIFLGWSFWSSRWDITWIVWPIAGVLFAAVSAVMKLAAGKDDSRK